MDKTDSLQKRSEFQPQLMLESLSPKRKRGMKRSAELTTRAEHDSKQPAPDFDS